MRTLPLFSLMALLAAPALAATVPVPAFAAADPTEAAAAQDATPITRAYDVGGVLPDLEHQVETFHPLVLGERWDAELDGFGEGVDVLEAMLLEVVAPEAMQQDGCAFEVPVGDRAVLTAPAAVHADFERLLAFLTDALDRRVRVRIEVFALDEAPDASAEALEGALAAGRLRKLHDQRLSLALGTTARPRAVRTTRFLKTWDIEIAQTSFAAYATHDDVETGVVGGLRVEQELGTDGYRVRALLRTSELQALVAREAEVRGTTWSESGVGSSSEGGVVQIPDVATATIATSDVLRPGESFTALAWTRTHGEPFGVAVRVGLEDVEPAPQPLALGAGSGRVLTAIDVSVLCWGPLGAPFPDLDRRHDDEGEGGIRFPSHDFDGDAFGAWDAVWEAFYASGGEGDAIFRIGTAAVIAAPPALTQTVLDKLVGRAGTRARRTVDVVLGDPAGVVSRVRVPVLEGERATIVVGREGLAVTEYDTEVANSAMASGPEVEPWFDGLGVRVLAHGGGRATLELVTRRLVALETSPGRYPRTGAVSLPTFEMLTLPLELQVGAPREVSGVQAGLGAPGLSVRASLLEE